jgi:P-type conjugative transfer protein TrbG
MRQHSRPRTLVLGAIRAALLAAVAWAALIVYAVHAQDDPTHDSTVLGSDPVAAATRDYQRTGVARPVQEGTFLSFPYGHAQPTVTCAPLRACVIELEPGEVILSKIAGDTQRWEIQLAPAGPDGRTPLIAVKPHDCGITTNLVLATSAGRIYDLTLDSPPCPHGGVNPRGSYVRHVRFYYPDSMVQATATSGMWGRTPTSAASSATPASPAIASTIETLNFDYRIVRDKRFSWVPAAIFDDGAHCFIKLPSDAAHRDAPVLFSVADDGSRALVNYTLSGDTYVTDRVFRTGILVISEGGREHTLRIENRHYDPPPPVRGTGGTAPMGD